MRLLCDIYLPEFLFGDLRVKEADKFMENAI